MGAEANVPDVAASVGLSLGGVAVVLSRATKAGLDWAAVQRLSDVELEERVYGVKSPQDDRPIPDCAYLHAERKKPGVTLQLLHIEYLEKVSTRYAPS